MFHRALIAAVSLGALISTARAENWPQWRGPQHDGASRETGLPIAWDETSAIAWKCELPEWGQSTPVIWDGAIFVTTQVDDRKLLLLKLDKQSGRIEWTREVADAETPRMAKGEKPTGKRGWQKFHVTHNLATPSPVTNGEVVVAHFGSGDLAAYDFSGNQLWHRNLQEEYGSYSIWWGHANSPVIAGDLVVSVCMQDTCADLGEKTFESYLVAHDLKTGAVRWKVARPTQAPAEEGDAYTTPLLWDRGPRKELVIWGAQILDAYDPPTGRKLWQMGGFFGNRVVPSPLAKGNILYIIQGKKDPLVAVEVPPAAADGESSAAVAELSREAVAWEFDQGTSDSPTP
ncbi:MAG: PQQ-binding-like beta-propeller repeat protein, partial [Planctomycetota bacterium]